MPSPLKYFGEVAENGKFTFDKPPPACEDFARLQVAQDSLIEELQCKIIVSKMVAESVLRGVLSAVSDEQNAAFEEVLHEKDQKFMQMKSLLSQTFDKMKQQEFYILEREREMSRMAENLVDLTFRLNAESLNNSSHEKKLKEMQARDARKLQQISALTDELERLKSERDEATEFREIVKERKQAREAGSLRQITELTDELEKVKMEQSNESDMLKRDFCDREQKLREEIEENEKRLVALRAENSQQQGMIAEKQREYADLDAAHRKTMQVNEELGRKIREQEIQCEEEAAVLLDILHEQMLQMKVEEQIVCDLEEDILSAYFSSFIVVQEAGWTEKMAAVEGLLENSRMEESRLRQKLENSDILREKELEAAILFECFLGFAEDVKHARSTRFTDRRKSGVEERLIEQHHQHQVEMDMLLEFFVGKLHEHVKVVETSAGFEAEGEVARLQANVATLKREKDEIISEKTEEMFRMKRDFLKELDKLKLDGSHYEYGILKRYFTDARQKVNSLLDRAQSESTSNQKLTGGGLNPDEQSDADSVTSKPDPPPPGFERFTEKLPEWVSELQNDIEQLMSDTFKPEDSQKLNATVEDLRNELDTLAQEYESACKELEQERCQNYALTMEMQQLEHNISLSNGELEKLHGQLEEEKKAKLGRDAQLDNLKHDIGLLKMQLESFQAQKLGLQNDLRSQHLELRLANESIEALQKELGNVLKVKGSISGERDRLTDEMSKMCRDIARFQNQLCVGIKNQTGNVEKRFFTLQQALDDKQARLDKLIVLVEDFHRHWKVKDSEFKRKLNWYHRNLRKAEDEVDVLGDENEYLIGLLERLYLALNHYEPVLQHYPQISELSKLIKTELVSRIDPQRDL